MLTEYVVLDKCNIEETLKRAGELIRNGELVAFPTETVYGLGANGFDSEAVKSIFYAKRRPIDNPLILHIYETDQIYELVSEVTDAAKVLMKAFWPGPLTLIFKKSNSVIDEVTAGLDTVAIRMPDDKLGRAFLKECAVPVAAPSANKSTKPSPTRAIDVLADFDGEIPMILDGGSTDFGLESTVVDTTVNPPMVLRPGAVSLEQLRVFFPDVNYDIVSVDGKKKPKSPGQKYKHYAPNADVYVFCGEHYEVIKAMNSFISAHERVGCVIRYVGEEIKGADKVIVPRSEELKSYSQIIFSAFRDLDKIGCKYILVEGVGDSGLGKAIMNRLYKSSSGKIIYVSGGN